jgi:pilus assembly protein CpaF
MGLIPTFIEKLEQKGVIIPRTIFSNDPKAQTQAAAAPLARPMGSMPKMPMMPPPLKKAVGTGSGTSGNSGEGGTV